MTDYFSVSLFITYVHAPNAFKYCETFCYDKIGFTITKESRWMFCDPLHSFFFCLFTIFFKTSTILSYLHLTFQSWPSEGHSILMIFELWMIRVWWKVRNRSPFIFRMHIVIKVSSNIWKPFRIWKAFIDHSVPVSFK